MSVLARRRLKSYINPIFISAYIISFPSRLWMVRNLIFGSEIRPTSINVYYNTLNIRSLICTLKYVQHIVPDGRNFYSEKGINKNTHTHTHTHTLAASLDLTEYTFAFLYTIIISFLSIFQFNFALLLFVCF